MKDTTDPNTGNSLGCWNTINTDAIPEMPDAERIIFDLKPQSANSEIIVAFMDTIESGKLRLLEKRNNSDFTTEDRDNFESNVLPFTQTDFLIEEVANLKLKQLPSAKLTVERVIRKFNKDRYSALAYGLWYIKTFENNVEDIGDRFESLEDFIIFV